ncbi:sodium:solute symporter family protein [Amycolatopsis taiwanensis]|uniref:sodium:solute symporter family protein n=1 Tax=Amycolatopsis taiwanensis TaxID=342230 RepID=UPI0004B62AF6|nr:sodium:solute symporter family protein [Amycolatopsis taiwanensis]
MPVSATVALVIVFLATSIGLLARGRQKMSLDQWSVAGRNLGWMLLWVLMAGEALTTATFLGAPGQAYAQGAPSLFIMCYTLLAYIVSFFLLPPLWRYAKRHKLVTQGDYFTHRFDSPRLGAFVAVVGVVFVVPYTVIQLVGMGSIASTITGGALSKSTCIVIGFVCVTGFVFVAGIRSTAWTAVLKDILIVIAVIIVGIVLPLRYFGSYTNLLDAVNAAHPGHLALPGATHELNVPWFLSTVLLASAGFYMYPHLFMAGLAARNEQSIRRNAMVLPIYLLVVALPFYAGLTALMVVPGLSGADTNTALLTLVVHSVPGWLAGVIAGAGALAAMVPASALVLGAATLLSRNIYQGLLRPDASRDTVLRVSRLLVLAVMAVALVFSLTTTALLNQILVNAYSGISQLFPGVLLSLVWRRVSKQGVTAGIVVGLVVAFALILTGHDPFLGINAGLVGLLANAMVTVAVSLRTPAAVSAARLSPAHRTLGAVPGQADQEVNGGQGLGQD